MEWYSEFQLDITREPVLVHTSLRAHGASGARERGIFWGVYPFDGRRRPLDHDLLGLECSEILCQSTPDLPRIQESEVISFSLTIAGQIHTGMPMAQNFAAMDEYFLGVHSARKSISLLVKGTLARP